MGESEIIELTEGNFDKTIGETDKLVVVEFYTTTCPNCAAMVPVYAQVARDLTGKVVFAKVDSARNMRLALRFGVMGVPTFKFLCRGKEIGSMVGATNQTAFANTVKDFIRHGEGCKSTSLVYEMDGYA